VQGHSAPCPYVASDPERAKLRMVG